MRLDPEETKKKAWEAIYKFYEYVKPLLLRYNVDEVVLALCGSVARGEAKCPRDKDNFCRKVRDSIIYEADFIEHDDGLPLEYVLQVIDDACREYTTTDEIIEYIKKKFPNTLFAEIVESERCSDVDGKIIVPDEAYEYIVHDRDYFTLIEEGNELVSDIVYPLTPEIGFQPMSIFKKLNGFERCEYRIVKVEESYPTITSVFLKRMRRIFRLRHSH